MSNQALVKQKQNSLSKSQSSVSKQKSQLSDKPEDEIIVEGFEEALETRRKLLVKQQQWKREKMSNIGNNDISQKALTEEDMDPEHIILKNGKPSLISIKLKKQKINTLLKGGLYVYETEELADSEEDRGRFMIRVNDSRKTIWDLFIITVAIYNCFSIPLKIAFDPPILDEAGFEIADNIIDFLFVLDILVAFRTTFYDMETGDEVFVAKETANAYFKSRFLIDFVSTVPIDTVGYIFTGSKNPTLQLFSLLKLVRVTRLSRIIARLNVPADLKNYMKLFQLIFMIILYMHCQGCAWFFIVMMDEKWKAALDGPDPTADYYSNETPFLRKYLTAFYSSILLLTSNDLGPVGRFQTLFVVCCILMGSIANANIFGNMALLISEMNRKNNDFQTMIDTSNTAMKNLDLPPHIHIRIVTYLNYIYSGMDSQKELKSFFEAISPALKDEVCRHIFAVALRENPLLQYCKSFNEKIIKNIKLVNCLPEEVLIQQDDPMGDWFLISKGDCEVYVKDGSQDKYVRSLFPGMYFGEISILRQSKRTATVKSKTYSTIGKVEITFFMDLMSTFPQIRNRMHNTLITYQDRFKSWLKFLVSNVSFLKDFKFEIMERIVQKILIVEIEEETVVFKTGENQTNIYILMEGEVLTYLQLGSEILLLDTINEPGSVFGECAFLHKKEGNNFCMRISKQARFLIITDRLLIELRNEIRDLDYEVSAVAKKIEYKGFPMLDYRIRPKVFDKNGLTITFDPKQTLINGISKVMKIKQYKRGKGFKFSDLLLYLKRNTMNEEDERNDEADAVLGRVNDILVEKLFTTLCDPVDRMLVQQEKINFKLGRITSLLHNIRIVHEKKLIGQDVLSKSESNGDLRSDYPRNNLQKHTSQLAVIQSQHESPDTRLKRPVGNPVHEDDSIMKTVNKTKLSKMMDANTQVTPQPSSPAQIRSPKHKPTLKKHLTAGDLSPDPDGEMMAYVKSDKYNYIEYNDLRDKTETTIKFGENSKSDHTGALEVTELKNFEEWHSAQKSSDQLPRARKPLNIQQKDNSQEQLQLFSQWKDQGSKSQIKQDSRFKSDKDQIPKSGAITPTIDQMLREEDSIEESEIDIGLDL